jgi:hypothetical protein
VGRYQAPGNDDPLVPPNFGSWFGRIGGVVRHSFAPLATLWAIEAVVVVVIGVITTLFTPDLTGLTSRVESGVPLGPEDLSSVLNTGTSFGIVLLIGLIGSLVVFVLGAYLASASVFVAIRNAAGQPTSAAEGLRLGASRAFPLIGWWLLAGIMTGVGSVFLLLPGLYLAVVFNASLMGVVVVERAGIGRCFALVNPRLLPTAGRILLAMVGSFVCVLAIVLIAGSLNMLGSGLGSIAGTVVEAILLIPFGVIATAVIVVTYAELRYHEQGTSTAMLATELGR